ncbi:hypothetical protein [Niveispirillum sp. SYP-B3756]|uniref:hypothetical protein n=1 Tax=Niveispirillum sp. SYP-B3756 TaxID=2662178 RepID=UPI001291B850|nr:hypothetical protein [Niveispirillum sp. SYP-B3756]
MSASISEISLEEMDDVSGGALFIMPLAIAFFQGSAAGATTVGLIAATGDALGYWDVF